MIIDKCVNKSIITKVWFYYFIITTASKNFTELYIFFAPEQRFTSKIFEGGSKSIKMNVKFQM